MGELATRIFLDFDGVLFDTAREAFVVGLHAWFGEMGVPRELALAERIFYGARPYVGPAWNYFYVFRRIEAALSAGRPPEDFAAFLSSLVAEMQAGRAGEYAAFETAFFASRKALQNRSEEEWLRLQRPFPFFSVLRERLPKADGISVMIVTTKDRASVNRLLRSQGMRFPEEAILDRRDVERAGTKAELIVPYAERKPGQAASRLIFLDDSVQHLREAKARVPSLICLCPDWGYVAPGWQTSSAEEVLEILFSGAGK